MNSRIPDPTHYLNDDFVYYLFRKGRRGVMVKPKIEKAKNEKSEEKEEELLTNGKISD
jgi:hypothetical protein